MKYRSTLIGMVAAAALMGTAGVAHADHQPDGYSPCRPTNDDETRVGYSDDGDQSDPRHELPTVYGSQEDMGGYIGICGGGSKGAPVQFVQVDGQIGEAPTVTHSAPPEPLPNPGP